MANTTQSRNRRVSEALSHNRARAAVIAALAFIFISGLFSMSAGDWFVTVLRGLSVGAITFLVASGLSLIFGLMDVLNLAHGELFMLGAYIGWTVYVRPDTFVDILFPLGLIVAVILAKPLFDVMASRITIPGRARGVLSTIFGVIGLAISLWAIRQFPLSIWDLKNFADSPISNSLALDTGIQRVPTPAAFTGPATLVIVALIVGAALVIMAFSLVRRSEAQVAPIRGRRMALIIGVLVLATSTLIVNDAATAWFFGLGTTSRFVLALGVATISGFFVGTAIEIALIRPLYERPIYQLMITLGLGFIIIESVRAVWGRPEFTMPKPAIFNGTGAGCPGEGLGDLFSKCSTVKLFDTRIRTYNEFFVIVVGVAVLAAVTLLLKRTRLGMIIRAGVEDREMVEALGVNVRQVFTIVFGLGVALAAFGGVMAAPALGLSVEMGSRMLLLALVAMAVGGLTSFPGAAAGAVLIGLLQQFVIKAGSTGIPLPWLEEPFKPSPSLVPVSGIILMIVVLLVAPQGLFGREE